MAPPARETRGRRVTRRRSRDEDDSPSRHSTKRTKTDSAGSDDPADLGDKPTPARRQAACQPCRLRKVKCDKQKPVCNICRVSEQKCEYVGDTSEKISLETATRTLLDRIDGLHREFDSLKRSLRQNEVEKAYESTQIASKSDHLLLRPASPPQTPLSAEASSGFLRIPPHRASADAVLQWEIFENKYGPSELIGDLFKSTLNDSQLGDTIVPASAINPLDDEQIPALIDRFLQNIHTKNPILDVELLVKHGRRCANQGVGWDGRSCLVLLACALGSIAKPFENSVEPTAHKSNRFVPEPKSSSLYAKELQQGDSCFTLACRRLGALKYSIVGAQCHFFAGVYLMYTLRPLLSWHYFLHASVFCQMQLRLAEGIPNNSSGTSSFSAQRNTVLDKKSHRLEQSLYWSCFKSECEFRVELPLAQSEISSGEYPDLFPSPPSPVAYDTTTQGLLGEDSELRQHTSRLCNEEESWYYYLTEIALRRIGNRIMNAFFCYDRSSWINIKPLLPIAEEFKAQVSSWSANLPPAMQRYQTSAIIRAPHLNFSNEGAVGHVSQELSWAIDNRLLEMQTWLYQPFLYYLIHVGCDLGSPVVDERAIGHGPRISSLLNPFSSGTSAMSQTGSLQATQFQPSRATILDSDELRVLHTLISSGIRCCLKTIDVRSRGHRHHGLWFDLRSIMTASFILLAIIKSGHDNWIEGGVESVWGGASNDHHWSTSSQPPIGGRMATVLSQLRFWASESPDLSRYENVLELLVRDVRGF